MDRTTNRIPTLIFGGLLVLVGVLFLLQNFVGLNLGAWNWWALFILLPAAGALDSAWRTYQAQGRLTRAARGPLIFGVGLTLVATMLFFGLAWGTLWPLFLILFGAALLVVR